MTERDVWTVARVVAGYNVDNDTKNNLPQPLRGIVRILAAVSPSPALAGQGMRVALAGARAIVWDQMVAMRVELRGLGLAVAHVDPESPPPVGEREVDTGEVWEPIRRDAEEPARETGEAWEPIRCDAVPLVAPFPIDVFPEAAARLVVDGARSIGCPPDFLGVAMLAVAGGVIGRSVSLELKPGYMASTSLFVACVGHTSEGKTPALRAVVEPLRRIDASLAEEHAQALARWDEAKPRKTGASRIRASADPRPVRIDVGDISMSALPDRLADNPRGLIMVRDELSAFLLGMNSYKGGKGTDRAMALEIWSGGAIKKDRRRDRAGKPISCDSACLSIIGGLSPDVLGSFYDPKGAMEGIVDRFLFAYPDSIPVPAWSDDGIADEVSEGWYEIVSKLWERTLDLGDDGRPAPLVAQFSQEGNDMWKRHYDRHAAEMNAPDFPPALRGTWGKLREYAGRLALILACLDVAGDPAADVRDVPVVRARTVENAWRLVDYFRSHVRRVHQAIERGPGAGGKSPAGALLDWIKETGRRSFTTREAKQSRRWIADDELGEALAYLQERHVIRLRMPVAGGPRGGRPGSRVFEVNPEIFVTQNPQNLNATRVESESGGAPSKASGGCQPPDSLTDHTDRELTLPARQEGDTVNGTGSERIRELTLPSRQEGDSPMTTNRRASDGESEAGIAERRSEACAAPYSKHSKPDLSLPGGNRGEAQMGSGSLADKRSALGGEWCRHEASQEGGRALTLPAAPFLNPSDL